MSDEKHAAQELQPAILLPRRVRELDLPTPNRMASVTPSDESGLDGVCIALRGKIVDASYPGDATLTHGPATHDTLYGNTAGQLLHIANLTSGNGLDTSAATATPDDIIAVRTAETLPAIWNVSPSPTTSSFLEQLLALPQEYTPGQDSSSQSPMRTEPLLTSIEDVSVEEGRYVQPPVEYALHQPVEYSLAGPGISASIASMLRHGPLFRQQRFASRGDIVEGSDGKPLVVGGEISPGLPLVLADAAHLDSALLNLALNARDAMPGGGSLQIEAHAEGELVVIAVSDTGEGMAPEVLAQACEPFFSTKGAQGSGLGLSMVQGFARQSGGELRIQSASGQGTRIEIWLPVAAHPTALAPGPKAQPVRGRGRILVVDDDADVGRVTSAFLRKAGYDVITVSSGDEALAMFSANLLFDVLVTDYAMNGMNGADLVLQAKEMHPALPALVITGYAGAEGLDRLPANVAILRKPFQREDLARRVERLIERETFPPSSGEGSTVLAGDA